MFQQLLFAAVVSGALYALVALGLNLVYGSLRLLNIAHGDLVMIGAYTAFWSFTLLGISPVVSLATTTVLCSAFGFLVYVVLLKRQLGSPALAQRLEANSLIIFYGLSVILQNGASLAFSATSRGYQFLDGVHSFGGVSATGSMLLLLVVAAAVTLGALAFLRFHVAGWSLLAVIERKDAAAVVGVNVERVQMISICAGFAIAGVAGVLVSMTQQITPFMGFPFTIAAFVVVIMGGLGNIAAGIAAGFSLLPLPNATIAFATAAGFSSVGKWVWPGMWTGRNQGWPAE